MDGLTQHLAVIRAALEPLGGQGWLVGGGLRDLLLGRPVTDVDIAFDGDARAASRALAKAHGAGCYELSPSFGSWRVHGGDLPFTIDLTPLQGKSIAEDIRRRDLTVNALALPTAPSVDETPLDLVDGLRDLAAGRMRMVAQTAFAKDPVRLLRLARQTAQLSFTIDPATADQARKDASSLWESAGERIFDEVVRMIATDHPVDALRVCDDIGALAVLCSDGAPPNAKVPSRVERAEALWDLLTDLDSVVPEHTGELRLAFDLPLADGLSRRDALVIASLWTGVAEGDGAVVAWCRRLRTSSRVRDQLGAIVSGYLRRPTLGEGWTRERRYRFVTAEAPVSIDIALLVVSGALNSEREAMLAWATAIVEMQRFVDECASVRPLIAGDDLSRTLGCEPGPWLREALAHVREAQLIRGLATRDDAIALVRTFLRKVRTDPE